MLDMLVRIVVFKSSCYVHARGYVVVYHYLYLTRVRTAAINYVTINVDNHA